MEGAGDGRAALDEELEHARAAEGVEHVAEVAGELEARVDAGAGGRGAEHDPQRVGAVGVADGQLGVVGPHRPGADEHGVGLGPEPVHVGPRRRRR